MNNMKGFIMKRFALLSGVVFALLLTACTGAGKSGNKAATNQEALPNIVYIISDDQAWTDYGFTGHPYIQTPNIDRLAQEGRTYTRGYSVAPLCSPSLATLITGVYPQQHGITGNDPQFELEGRRYGKEWAVERRKRFQPWLDRFQQHPTVPQLLSDKGYLSFQSGKWWGGHWKEGGFTGGMTHGDPTRGGRHGDEGLKIGREGLKPVFDFIDRATAQDKPFFLWYAPFLPHLPHTPPDSLLQKYIDKTPSEAVARYWAMCEWFDQTIGELLQQLENKGLSENTLVIYACDNGWIQDPEKRNAYMPGSKQDPNEMGIRTPLIFHWPNRIKPRLDTTTLVSTVDLVPTMLDAASVPALPEMPGLSALDSKKLEARDTIFAIDFDHDMVSVNDPGASLQHRIVLTHPWKLIDPEPANEPGQPELYNIFEDPFETNNLAGKHPELVARLKASLDNWWKP